MLLILASLLLLLAYLELSHLVYPLPYMMMKWWNFYLQSVVDSQNLKHTQLSGITSLALVADSTVTVAKKLEAAISAKRETIFDEIVRLRQSGYSGIPTSSLDEIQAIWLQHSKTWRCLWIKFYGNTWARSASQLPTLRDITAEFPEIELLHVSILEPGAELSSHRGIHNSVWRFHYPLQVPEGDVGLQINSQIYRWQPHQAILWDDTQTHAAWNRSNESRIVIFADLHRELPWLQRQISLLLYRLLRYTSHVQSIAEKLRSDSIVWD